MPAMSTYTVVTIPSSVDVLFAASTLFGTHTILTGTMCPLNKDGTRWFPHLHSVSLVVDRCWSLVPCFRIFHTAAGAPPPVLRLFDESVDGEPCLGRPTQDIRFQVSGFESITNNNDELLVTWDKDGEGRFSTVLGSFHRELPTDITRTLVEDCIKMEKSSACFKPFTFDYRKEIIPPRALV